MSERRGRWGSIRCLEERDSAGASKQALPRSPFFLLVLPHLHPQDPGQDQRAEGASGPGTGLRRDPGHQPLAREGVRGRAPVRRHQPAEHLTGQRAQPAPQPPRRLPARPPAPPAPALRFPLHPSQQSPERPASVCRQVGAAGLSMLDAIRLQAGDEPPLTARQHVLYLSIQKQTQVWYFSKRSHSRSRNHRAAAVRRLSHLEEKVITATEGRR